MTVVFFRNLSLPEWPKTLLPILLHNLGLGMQFAGLTHFSHELLLVTTHTEKLDMHA